VLNTIIIHHDIIIIINRRIIHKIHETDLVSKSLNIIRVLELAPLIRLGLYLFIKTFCITFCEKNLGVRRLSKECSLDMSLMSANVVLATNSDDLPQLKLELLA